MTRKAEKQWRKHVRDKQCQETHELPPLENEADFAKFRWTGQRMSDEFFKLHDLPQFGGLGDNGVVLPPHSLSISRSPTVGASVIAAYRHGLSYAEQVFGAGGVGLLGALWGIPLGYMCYSMWDDLDGFLFPLLIAFGFVITWFMLRFDTVGYRYTPVLFDRKASKVHVFVDHTKFFSLWPLWGGGKHSIHTYDWACVRAQVNRFRVVTGKMAQDNVALKCIVFKAPDSVEVVGQFPLGITSSALAIQPLLDHWEHIRRFMEHQGPLFQAGEGPYKQPSTTSLLGAVCFGQPFIGPGAREQWQTRDALVIGWQLIAPLFLPFTMLFGLLRWTSLHLKTKPRWPVEILASVGGEPLTAQELETWSKVMLEPADHDVP